LFSDYFLSTFGWPPVLAITRIRSNSNVCYRKWQWRHECYITKQANEYSWNFEDCPLIVKATNTTSTTRSVLLLAECLDRNSFLRQLIIVSLPVDATESAPSLVFLRILFEGTVRPILLPSSSAIAQEEKSQSQSQSLEEGNRGNNVARFGSSREHRLPRSCDRNRSQHLEGRRSVGLCFKRTLRGQPSYNGLGLNNIWFGLAGSSLKEMSVTPTLPWVTRLAALRRYNTGALGLNSA